jgi:hypothetical protein
VQEQINQHHSQPSRVLEVDERATGTVPIRKSQVAASKDQRQVGIFISTERGHKATAVLCMSAEGTSILS